MGFRLMRDESELRYKSELRLDFFFGCRSYSMSQRFWDIELHLIFGRDV
jgi:hypothetical protein